MAGFADKVYGNETKVLSVGLPDEGHKMHEPECPHGQPLLDTLVGYSCRTLLYETLLWDTLMGHSCGTLL